jgi:hypothetical protein
MPSPGTGSLNLSDDPVCRGVDPDEPTALHRRPDGALANILLARAEVLADLKQVTAAHHFVGVFVVTLALGLAVGAVWEMAEYTSDHFFARTSRGANATPRRI